MITVWFHPLTPALIFLAGAFVLIIPGLPWRSKQGQLLVLSISVLAFINVASRISFQQTAGFFDTPVLFVSWLDQLRLTLRLDGLSIAFIFIPVLLLLAISLSDFVPHPAFNLAAAGSLSLLFAAANGLALIHALLLFDGLACLYWWQRGQATILSGRLALAFISVLSLMLAGIDSDSAWRTGMLALVLWLRVGFMPFLELTLVQSEDSTPDVGLMLWIAFSTVVGVYVAARFPLMPFPPLFMLLIALTMLIQAGLSFVSVSHRPKLALLHLVSTQPLLALLLAPISARVSVSMSLTYTLALGVFLAFAHLGQTKFS